MKNLIISEEEKNRIRLLYEENKKLPEASNFVSYLAKELSLKSEEIIGLDWSKHKNNKDVSNLFNSSKEKVNAKIEEIKKDKKKLSTLQNKIKYVPTDSSTAEQKSYLRDLIKNINTTTTQQTTTQQTTTQQTTTRPSTIDFSKIVAKPTLARY